MGKKKTGSKPPPICKAILLCKDTIVEAETNHISVIGIVDMWSFVDFPDETPPFMVYVQLTNGLGRYAVSVHIYDLQSDESLGQAQVAEVDFPDRQSKVHLFLQVAPLQLDHAGRYDLVVLADGQEVDRQQFQAIQLDRGMIDETEEDEEDPPEST